MYLRHIALFVSVASISNFAAFSQNSALGIQMDRLQFSAVEVDAAHFASMRDFALHALGLRPILDKPDMVAFVTAEGSIYELYGPTAPDAGWRHGQGGMVVGFLTADIKATSRAIEAAGGVMVGDLNVAPHLGIDGGDYGYRLFRAPDSRVYALAQNKNFHK